MRVVLRFDKPQTVFRLPASSYPLSGPYNGFSGADRRRGAQLLQFFARNGWTLPPRACSVTGVTRNLKWHNEDYDRPWTALAVSRRAHRFIHMRFRWPDRWRRFLREEAMPESWAWSLSEKAVPVSRARTAAEHVEVMLAEAPHPDWVVVPVNEFRGMR